MVTSELSEYYESAGRGFYGAWSVAEDYAISAETVVPLYRGRPTDPEGERARKTYYMPLGRPELPSEFAKLASGDHDTALAFIRRYGLLGWQRSFDPFGSEWEQARSEAKESLNKGSFNKLWETCGDPLSWIIRHAKTVQFVLDLSAALSEASKVTELIEALKVLPRGGLLYEWARRGFFYGTSTRRHPSGSPMQDALFIISDILNGNLSGCVRELIPAPNWDHPVRLDSGFSFHNLMDCIYWLLADAIVIAKVRHCLHCGKPIIAPSDRVKYCPPPMGSHSVSPCMNRAKQQRFRETADAKKRKAKAKPKRRKTTKKGET